MTPVKQTVLYDKQAIGNGNCLPACLASLLDLPLWMVPPFEQMYGRDDWRIRINEWLRRFFCATLERTDGHEPGKLPRLYIACGPSPRGIKHSVIFENGVLVHDPHYSDAGIGEVDWTYHIKPLA